MRSPAVVFVLAGLRRRAAGSVPRAASPGPLFDRDALRQVARLVDVAAPPDADGIGEQLQRDDVDDRLQERRRRGYGDHLVADAAQLLGIAVGDRDDYAVARLDLLEVALDLLEHLVAGGQR